LRQRQGQRVLRKGAGRVAVDVARELVEHQDLGLAPAKVSIFTSRLAFEGA
jgi:hypothetical protein